MSALNNVIEIDDAPTQDKITGTCLLRGGFFNSPPPKKKNKSLLSLTIYVLIVLSFLLDVFDYAKKKINSLTL
jgi:hypothetical protein